MSNPQSQKFEGSSKISWLLKIFGSIHYVSNTSHNFACVIFELCNQQKKKKEKAISKQPFYWNTSNASLHRVKNLFM